MDDDKLTRIILDICESRARGEGELDRDRVLADMEWLVTQIQNLRDQTEGRARNLRQNAQRIGELEAAVREKDGRIETLDEMNGNQHRMLRDEERMRCELAIALDKAKRHIAKVEKIGAARYATITDLKMQIAGLRGVLDRERANSREQNPHSTI